MAEVYGPTHEGQIALAARSARPTVRPTGWSTSTGRSTTRAPSTLFVIDREEASLTASRRAISDPGRRRLGGARRVAPHRTDQAAGADRAAAPRRPARPLARSCSAVPGMPPGRSALGARPRRGGGEGGVHPPQEPPAGRLRLRRTRRPRREPRLRAAALNRELDALRSAGSSRSTRIAHPRTDRHPVDEVGRRVAHHATRSSATWGSPSRRCSSSSTSSWWAGSRASSSRSSSWSHPVSLIGIIPAHWLFGAFFTATSHDRLHRGRRHHRAQLDHPRRLHRAEAHAGHAAAKGRHGGGRGALPADAAHRGGRRRRQLRHALRPNLPGAGREPHGGATGGDPPCPRLAPCPSSTSWSRAAAGLPGCSGGRHRPGGQDRGGRGTRGTPRPRPEQFARSCP